jgi:hypothetical protein
LGSLREQTSSSAAKKTTDLPRGVYLAVVASGVCKPVSALDQIRLVDRQDFVVLVAYLALFELATETTKKALKDVLAGALLGSPTFPFESDGQPARSILDEAAVMEASMRRAIAKFRKTEKAREAAEKDERRTKQATAAAVAEGAGVVMAAEHTAAAAVASGGASVGCQPPPELYLAAAPPVTVSGAPPVSAPVSSASLLGVFATRTVKTLGDVGPTALVSSSGKAQS